MTRGRDAGPAVIAVACPQCGARPRQRCATAYGTHTSTHAARKRAAAPTPPPPPTATA